MSACTLGGRLVNQESATTFKCKPKPMKVGTCVHFLYGQTAVAFLFCNRCCHVSGPGTLMGSETSPCHSGCPTHSKIKTETETGILAALSNPSTCSSCNLVDPYLAVSLTAINSQQHQQPGPNRMALCVSLRVDLHSSHLLAGQCESPGCPQYMAAIF